MYFYSKESSRIEDSYRMYSHLGYEGICAFCGDSFKSSSPKAKYCSQRCQNDAYMKRRKERKTLEKQKICAMCKKSLQLRKRMQCIVVMLASKRHIEKESVLPISVKLRVVTVYLFCNVTKISYGNFTITETGNT